jgi:hypothetical protein
MEAATELRARDIGEIITTGNKPPLSGPAMTRR